MSHRYCWCLRPVGHTLIMHTCLQTQAAGFALKLLECMVVRVFERLSSEQYSKSYLHLHVCSIDLDGVFPVGHTLIKHTCLQTKPADFTLN